MTVPTEYTLRSDSSTAEIVAVLNIMNNRVNTNTSSINEIVKKRGENQLEFSKELQQTKEEILKEFNNIREKDRQEISEFKEDFYAFTEQYKIEKAVKENAPSTWFDGAFKEVAIDAFKLLIVAGVVYLVSR